MQTILNHLLAPGDKMIKYGQLDEKILLELKMTTSLYDYIEIVTDYYDDEELPYLNNWTDVEGMGYGWAWSRCDEKDWHKMMSKMVGYEADSLIKDEENTLYFVYKGDKVKKYHFITLYGKQHRVDTIISFSDEELYY